MQIEKAPLSPMGLHCTLARHVRIPVARLSLGLTEQLAGIGGSLLKSKWRFAGLAATALISVGGTACGGGSAGTAKVGACIDANQKVVDCSSTQATQRLVTDQNAPNAVACVQIGDKPQVEVKVGGHPYCAESK